MTTAIVFLLIAGVFIAAIIIDLAVDLACFIRYDDYKGFYRDEDGAYLRMVLVPVLGIAALLALVGSGLSALLALVIG